MLLVRPSRSEVGEDGVALLRLEPGTLRHLWHDARPLLGRMPGGRRELMAARAAIEEQLLSRSCETGVGLRLRFSARSRRREHNTAGEKQCGNGRCAALLQKVYP